MKHTIKFANWLNRWNDWSGILRISLATSLFVIIIVLLLSLRRRKFYFIKNFIKNRKKIGFTHNWHWYDLFHKPTYCNVCESVMVSGAGCTHCNLYTDEKCLKKADKMFKCKHLCDTHEKDVEHKIVPRRLWQHHWIKGNLKLNSSCFVCHENDCGCTPNLSDYRCCWCLRTVHESCLNSVSNRIIIDKCDFGVFKRVLLKPNLLVNTSKLSSSSIKDYSLNLSDPSEFEDWTPLFVFSNSKSGSADADVIMSHFNSILNPLQVIEMDKNNIENTLSWMKTYSDLVQFKILVCGGDGSIGWILDTLSKHTFKKFEPAVGILPLGTGNDLSRTLKWGQGYVGDVDIEDILHDVEKANYVKLDRWLVKIEKADHQRTSIGNSLLEKVRKDSGQLKYMNNYLSIGCDALVTLNFHRQRQNMFFPNRIINKLIYFKYGTIDTFLKECRTLTQNLELELDGTKIKLPHLESIVVLNISHWGGGVEPWGIGKGKFSFPEPKIDDGYLEVFGIYSSFHIAQLQVGLAEPYRIGRAKNIRIKISKRFPVQIDGEPFEQNPAIFEINCCRQVTMLTKS